MYIDGSQQYTYELLNFFQVDQDITLNFNTEAMFYILTHQRSK